MGTITITVKDDVEERFRKTVKRVLGGKKGKLGKAVTEALNDWSSDMEQDLIKARALKRLERGYDMGKTLYKDRSELHER